MTEQIFQSGEGKWYYWDESGLEIGPFNSYEQTEAALAAYIKYDLDWVKDDPIHKMRDNMGV